jgi:hypothetical protein
LLLSLCVVFWSLFSSFLNCPCLCLSLSQVFLVIIS